MKVHLITGCFDGFHEGHKHILNQAKWWDQQEPYHLIVLLNDDAYITRHKGKPIDDVETRIKNLKGYADRVLVFSEDNPRPHIEALQPDRIFCGGDYLPEQHCAYGVAPIVVIPRYKNFSSSHLRKAKYPDEGIKDVGAGTSTVANRKNDGESRTDTRKSKKS